MKLSGLERFKPAVPKRFLLFFAGALWIAVGVLLNSLALHWLVAHGGVRDYPYGVAGFLLAMVIHHFGFLRVVDKNLGRIDRLDGRPCAFSFMSWKSYLLVAVMMAMGILLRHSPIPKHYLAVLYIGLGLALILSSIRYFRILITRG